MKRVTLISMIALIFAFSYCIITKSTILYPKVVEAVTYNVGSSNQQVKQIEQRLKQLGFFTGTPDNYYDNNTKNAVIKFQKSKGLKADGIVGDQTLKALNISSNKSSNSNPDTQLLARLINGEGRGEPYIGQVAIGAVVLNRTRDPRFPRTIPGVIYQPGAFTAIADGQINAAIEESPKKAANDAMNGWDPSGGAVFYYNPAKTTNKWIWSRPVIKKIGKHIFTK
ncbi:MAG: spore cortex-lytic enzyme [Clostridiales bacterium]|nr:spore cortex-lytic enzyme [Clostridiales bacterium]